MQLSLPLAAPRAAAALCRCAAVAGGLIAAHALAQPAPPAADMSQPFPALCIAEAHAIVQAAFKEGHASAALQRVPAATASELAREGINRGALSLHSLISPPSTFELYQLPGAGGLREANGCALHQTYLGYRQGGFVPQPLRFYGPLKPAPDRLSVAASSG
jgi:hypothetical protein